MNAQSAAPFGCDGQQVFALGKFWPVAFIAMDRFGGKAMFPDRLWLIEGDRLMVVLGDLPTVPAIVVDVEGDMLEIRYCQPLHQTVLAATGYAKCAAATNLLEAA